MQESQARTRSPPSARSAVLDVEAMAVGAVIGAGAAGDALFRDLGPDGAVEERGQHASSIPAHRLDRAQPRHGLGLDLGAAPGRLIGAPRSATRASAQAPAAPGAALAHRLDQVGIARLAQKHVRRPADRRGRCRSVAETGLPRLVAGQAEDQRVLAPRPVIGVDILRPGQRRDPEQDSCARRRAGCPAPRWACVQGHRLRLR